MVLLGQLCEPGAMEFGHLKAPPVKLNFVDALFEHNLSY